jgi:hypothetical protein
LMKNFYHFFSSFGYKLAPLRPTGLIFSPWKYEFNDFTSGPYWIAFSRMILKWPDYCLLLEMDVLPCRGQVFFISFRYIRLINLVQYFHAF